MKRNQLTITYPTKDATDLQQTLQHLKATQHLNLSAFCKASLPSAVQQSQKKLQRHLLQEIIEAAMLQDLQKTHKSFRNLEALVLGLIRQEYGKKNSPVWRVLDGTQPLIRALRARLGGKVLRHCHCP
jgi:hypothetical protein